MQTGGGVPARVPLGRPIRVALGGCFRAQGESESEAEGSELDQVVESEGV